MRARRYSDESDGDFRRRQAFRALLVFVFAVPVSVGLFAFMEPLWDLVRPLEGWHFLGGSALLGAGLAVSPLIAATALLLAVWHGVESVSLTRNRATPLLDRFIIGMGVLVWFAPALGLFAAAMRAILTGSIRFTRPVREYLLATDPIAFWQSVGFFLIVGAALAYPAWHYWRGKFRQLRQV